MNDVAPRPNLRVRYDRAADVLYVNARPGVPARSREEEPGLIWRYASDSGELVGVTILDLSTYWRQRRADLIAQIAARFAIGRSEAEKVLNDA